MNKVQNKKSIERIDGDTIILFDDTRFGPKIIKKVMIITYDGEKRNYEIKRTKNGGYLFN